MAGLLVASLAQADVLADGTIAPSIGPINIGIAAANKMKIEVYDVLTQERVDDKQRKLFENMITKKVADIAATRAKIKAELDRIPNAINAVDSNDKLDADAKVKQKAQLEETRTQLTTAIDRFDANEKLANHMIMQIHSVALVKDKKDRTAEWMRIRKNLVDENLKRQQAADEASKALTAAAVTIKTISGDKKVESVGTHMVTLKTWSCKKTEIYLNGSSEKANVNDSFALPADGHFTIRVMLVDARREQARKFEKERAAGKSSTSSVTITAASNWALSYSLGNKTTSWTVKKEDYDWKKPEGTRHVELTASGSSANEKSDLATFTVPTEAAVNNVHGWVRGEMLWKGAQEEQSSEDCQYDLNIAPKR